MGGGTLDNGAGFCSTVGGGTVLVSGLGAQPMQMYMLKRATHNIGSFDILFMFSFQIGSDTSSDIHSLPNRLGGLGELKYTYREPDNQVYRDKVTICNNRQHE